MAANVTKSYFRAFSSNADYIVFVIITFVVGSMIIILNALHLSFVHKVLFKNSMDYLVISFYHLCLADLLQGCFALLTVILTILEREIFMGDRGMIEITEFSEKFGYKYLSSVSILILNALTVLKMIRVTKNVRYTKSLINCNSN